MADLPRPAGRLVVELARLPGIGPRTARRLAFHLLARPRADAEALARAIVEASQRVTLCMRCFALAEGEECSICSDPTRDAGVICVVETPAEVFALERSGSYRGHYHVLGGVLSPLAGQTAADLRIKELLARIQRQRPREIVIALDTDTEGDATAHYLAGELAPFELPVSRLGTGLPTGASLEHADPLTITRAMEGRKAV